MGLDVLLFVVGATAVAGTSRRLGLSAPLTLVLTGLVVSFIPGIPAILNFREGTLEPEVVLLGFLPPLLYSAALESSYVGIRQNLRAIGLLSIGLVLFSTVVTGLVMYAVIPGMPLAAAFALGAIVAPPDAVAATTIGRRLGLPRRVVTILGGESLVNDATALTAYRVAVGAATGAGFSFLHGAGVFAVASVGGVVIGLAFGVGVQWLTVRLRDPVLESTCGLVTPWLAYLVAEHVHASGVLSVVMAGLYVGHQLPKATYASRLQGGAVWKVMDFVLETVVFALIGLQLPAVLQGLQEYGRWELASYGLVLFVCVVIARMSGSSRRPTCHGGCRPACASATPAHRGPIRRSSRGPGCAGWCPSPRPSRCPRTSPDAISSCCSLSSWSSAPSWRRASPCRG